MSSPNSKHQGAPSSSTGAKTLIIRTNKCGLNADLWCKLIFTDICPTAPTLLLIHYFYPRHAHLEQFALTFSARSCIAQFFVWVVSHTSKKSASLSRKTNFFTYEGDAFAWGVANYLEETIYLLQCQSGLSQIDMGSCFHMDSSQQSFTSRCEWMLCKKNRRF